jgi:hypothetical protein
MATAPAAPKSEVRYYRLRELCEKYGLHAATFTRYILKPRIDRRSGERFTLEAVRAPGGWRVPEGAVQRYFERVTASRLGAEPAAATATTSARREAELAAVRAQLKSKGY